MRYRFVPLMITLSACSLFAQDTKPATPVYGWSHGLVSQLTLTQAGYSNWVQGGENSLSYTLSADGKETYDDAKHNWATSYKFAFGQARLGGQGLRKTDDQISFESIYTHKLGTYINPYASVTLKSQFAAGYNYAADGSRTQVSDAFDPAYLTQGLGVGYQPVTEVKTRLGFALREILTSAYTTYADDPSTPAVEKTKIDGGLQFGAEVNWAIDGNVQYISKLDLFDAVKALDVVIVHWDNTLAAKVSKYIGVNLSMNVINEKAISPRTQIRETIGLSIAYNLL